MIQLVVTIGALAVVGWHSLTALNSMGRNTCIYIRMTYIAMSVGAFATIIDYVFYSAIASFSETMLIGGVALCCLTDRRRMDCNGP